MKIPTSILASFLVLFLCACLQTTEPPSVQVEEPSSRPANAPFSAMDVFKIAYAGDPVVSPNGHVVAFNRYYMDVMTDSRRNDLWLVDSDGQNLRQISKGFDAVGPAVFTHSGDAVAFMAVNGETSHIFLQQLDSAKRTELGQDLSEPSNLSFSPDGDWLAFTMPVEYKPETDG